MQQGTKTQTKETENSRCRGRELAGENGGLQEWETAKQITEDRFDDRSVVKNQRKYKIK